MRVRRRSVRSLTLLTAAVLAASCGGDDAPATAGTHELPAEEAEQYETASIARVVADAAGDDLEEAQASTW